ncbi:MAG: portal protein [Candidatus Heimdallarchaeaceae archaeon]
MKESYAQHSQANQSYWLEGTKDLRFKAGDQSLWNEIYSGLPLNRRSQFNFNRIRRLVNLVTGYQRRNRLATTVLPIEGSDEETADQFCDIIAWLANRMNMYHVISEAFEGALTTGMNLLSVWIDHRSDPLSGDLRLDNLSYNGYMIDSFFTKADLSDCNFVWTRKYLSQKQLISLLPERRKEIESMQGGVKDDKFSFMPENFNIRDPDLYTYDEYYYLDYRKQKVLIDPQAGQIVEWTGDDDRLKMFKMQFPQIQIKNIEKQTCKLAVVVNNHVMYNGPNPLNIDRYPFIPVMAYFEPEVPYYEWKIQGMVRGLRDSQYLYNRRKVIELDILESQINSGMKVMEGSLVDDADAFMTGQGRGLFIKKDAPLGMESVQQIPAPQIPPSMIQLSEILGKELQEISGVNEELMGSATDDKPGILSMLRQGAGLTTLQVLFDQLDLSQKLLGEVLIESIQSNFTAGKVQRILGDQPTQEFYNKTFGKFDCVVAEGQLTETQRQSSFLALMEMKQIGINIPDEILVDKAPIPDKKDLKEVMAQQAQAAQQQQQQAQQLQMQQLQAQTNLADARAGADRGLEHERNSRVLSNLGLMQERRAESVKDLEQASLDKIKAAKELMGVDLSQLQQLIDIVDRLRGQEETKVQEIATKTEGG